MALGAVLALLSAVAYAFGSSGHASEPKTEPPLTVILVDVSASMIQPRPGIRRWLLREVETEARAARAAGHEIALVTFAEGATRRFGPGKADALFAALRSQGAAWFRGAAPPVGPRGPRRPLSSTQVFSTSGAEIGGPGGAGDQGLPGTDLSGALLVALNLQRAGPRPAGRTVLIGDGTFTGEDPHDLLTEQSLGRLKWVQPGPGTKPDLELLRIRVPRAVPPGVPVRCQVDLRLTHGRSLAASTHVLLDWTLSVTSVAALKRGRNRPVASVGQILEVLPAEALWAAKNQVDPRGPTPAFSLPLVLPPMAEGGGELTVTASLSRLGKIAQQERPPAIGEAFADNNGGAAEWIVGDPTRVLIVAPSRNDAASRIAAMLVGRAFDGIEFRTATAAEVEERLDGARPPHVILTSGLPLAALPGPALEAFVLGGGGWLHSEGWSSLRGDGGVLGSLLALKPDVEPRKPRNIVFVVDGSGSMEGPRWQRAKYALAQLLPSIPAGDRLELRFFTQVLFQPQIEFEPAPASAGEGESARRRQDVMARLRDLQVPTGPTDIIGSVSMFMREREESAAAGDERSSLVLVISDGESTIPGTAPKPIRSTLMGMGDEIVAIQVGGDTGFRGPLSELAGGVESVVLAGELQGVLGILQEAVQGADPIEMGRIYAAPAAASPFAEMMEEAKRQAQLDSSLVIKQALPCRVAEGAIPLFEVREVRPESPADAGAAATAGTGTGTGTKTGTKTGTDLRRGVFAAVAARGLGTTAGIALPLLDPEGVRWAPELERRPQWLAPIFREMRQRYERGAAASEGAPNRPTAAIEKRAQGTMDPSGEAHGLGPYIVVRGLPADTPAEVRGVLRVRGAAWSFGTQGGGAATSSSGGVPSTEVAQLQLVPLAFGSGGASSRMAPRPPELDRLAKGTPLELELFLAAGDELGRGGEGEGGESGFLTLLLQSDGSRESDASLQPAPLLVSLRAREAQDLGGAGPNSVPGPLGGDLRESRGFPGHPLAPWLALGAALSLFFGALGAQRPWASRGRPAG